MLTTESVIGQQSQQVQSLCEQFSKQYNSKNNVKVRSDWGRMLHQIQQSELNMVNAKGEPVTGEDATALTFGAICKELNIPRSTAYHYINEYITVTTYPEAIQEEARKANLNLALDHVRSAYVAGEFPATLSELEAAGVVLKLKQAKAPKREEKEEREKEPITREELVTGLAELFKRAFGILAFHTIAAAIDQAMRDAKVPEAEKDILLHKALDSAGIP